MYAVEIDAPMEKVYRTIFRSQFMDSMVFKVLMRLRELPAKLIGKGVEFFPKEAGKLNEIVEKTAFTLLGKRDNEEMVFGLIGRFWDVINTDPRKAKGLEDFKAFQHPEYGKAVMNFYLEPSGNGTKLSTETRIFFSNERYLKLFKIYWFFISYLSGLTRRIFLKKIKADAEGC